MTDEARIEEVLSRRTSLRDRRGMWLNHWDDLARVQLPRRVGFVTQTTEGDRRTEDIFDGTPMQAARALANALGSMVRPEGENWHRVTTVDNVGSDEGADWLADTDERMRNAFANPKARMRQSLGEGDLDLVVFGTASVFTGEGDSNLLFQTLHLKDVLPFFGEAGAPEGVIRDRKLTVRQAVNRFGLEKLSDTVQELYRDNKMDDYVNFVHAVLPRPEGREDAILAKNLPLADLWIELDAKGLVSSGGFHEFPFAIPRWDTSSGEEYGRSPGMIALPDSNTAQAIQSTLLVAGQRAADPPLAVPDDSAIDAPNTYPGGLAYYDIESARAVGRIPIAPLDVGGNIPLTRDMQGDVRDQIWNAFFRNILRLPVGGPQMTATEINARKEEFIREIGPVFGRLETDYTAPIVERSFNIMLRAGALAPIPEVLQGRDVRFEYQSPIKRLRQQVEAAAAQQWAIEIVELSEVRPDALDLIDVDALGRFKAEAAGIPHNIVTNADEVTAIREARAQQQQEQAQMEQAQAGADVASTAANVPGLKGLLENAAGEPA